MDHRGAALLLTATPSFALFGIGDIVFDPTSYASLVSQLTTIESQYNMLKNNIEHFSLKQQWQTTLTALKNVNVANMFGETNGMTIAFNTNSASASNTAWRTATTPVSSYATTYLPRSVPWKPADVPARDDRDVRFNLAGLHYSRRCLSVGSVAELNRQYQPDGKPARQHKCDQQRGPATQPAQRG